MKTKFLLVAMSVTFSYAILSCSGNKNTNAASAADSVNIEMVEGVANVEKDSCCQNSDTCTASKDKGACSQKKACCDKK